MFKGQTLMLLDIRSRQMWHDFKYWFIKRWIQYFIGFWRGFCVFKPIFWCQTYQCLILCTSMVILGVRLYTMMQKNYVLLCTFSSLCWPLNLCSFYVSSFYFNKWYISFQCCFNCLFQKIWFGTLACFWNNMTEQHKEQYYLVVKHA